MRRALLLIAAGLLSSYAMWSSEPDSVGRRSSDEARRAACQELEEKVARQPLLLLERDAQIRLLTQKLDAAILEVVRGMAKLRGVESRAEAASNLAETEIALKSLPPASRQKDPDLAQAEQPLAMAAAEFRKENYGGTVYLASQAKTLIKARETRSNAVDSLPRVEGEVPFSVPLPLRATARSNIREGPGPTYRVAFAVEPDAPLTGYSYKGAWVRIRTAAGRQGWIYYA